MAKAAVVSAMRRGSGQQCDAWWRSGPGFAAQCPGGSRCLVLWWERCMQRTVIVGALHECLRGALDRGCPWL